jgi:hypothetical protein
MAKDKNTDSATSRDVRRVSQEVADRLRALGITLTGRETAEELVELQDAVEQFEAVVEARGGDLMVDEGPAGGSREPDDPHFALPLRPTHETVPQYLVRLARATDEVRRHRPKP